MSNLARLGSLALFNAQQAINTTGHNITNVNSEGYSRQSVSFEPQAAIQRGSAFVGQGARFAGITRNADTYINGQIQQFSSSAARVSIENSYLSRLDQLVSGSGINVGSAVQSFFNATQELANNPAGLPERQALLGQANALVTQAKALDGAFTELETEINNQFRSSVDEVNRLGSSIAQLNGRIRELAGSGANTQPNDLLDQRDRLLRELSGKVSIQTLAQADGTVDVFVAQGQSLVQGLRMRELTAVVAASDRTQLELAFKDSPSQRLTEIESGELKGLQELRNRTLVPNQRRVGLLMLNMTSAFNAAHRQGIDLAGTPGTDFFATSPPLVEGNTGNTGSASLSAVIQDDQALKSSRYRAGFDGTNWTLTRLGDGFAVTGAALGSLSIDGLQLQVAAGAANAGDSFEVDPGRFAIAGLSRSLGDPRAIAAARLEILDTPATANTGTLELVSADIKDPGIFQAASPVTLTYSATAAPGPAPGILFSWGAGSVVVPYDPATADSSGKSVDLPTLGGTFVLKGIPVAGDTITLTSQPAGKGDNRNALLLAQLQQQRLADGGQRRITEEYSAIVSSIGVATSQSNSILETETSLLEQANAYRDSSSGVNLDEEFSNLLKFQQYYQASAQLIKVADSLFQSLLNSL
jgi:flagellar hook-associated protein 1 FlgK